MSRPASREGSNFDEPCRRPRARGGPLERAVSAGWRHLARRRLQRSTKACIQYSSRQGGRRPPSVMAFATEAPAPPQARTSSARYFMKPLRRDNSVWASRAARRGERRPRAGDVLARQPSGLSRPSSGPRARMRHGRPDRPRPPYARVGKYSGISSERWAGLVGDDHFTSRRSGRKCFRRRVGAGLLLFTEARSARSISIKALFWRVFREELPGAIDGPPPYHRHFDTMASHHLGLSP